MGDEGCHIFCKGKVQGHTVRILIDTGASKSVISSRFAKTLDGLVEVEMADNQTSGIGPEKVEAKFVRLRNLVLNDLRIRKLVVGVVELDHVSALYEKMGHKTFEFILGGDILRAYDGLIDYAHKSLTLHE